MQSTRPTMQWTRSLSSSSTSSSSSSRALLVLRMLHSTALCTPHRWQSSAAAAAPEVDDSSSAASSTTTRHRSPFGNRTQINASILQNLKSMIDEDNDNTAKGVYARRRQQDAKAWAEREREQAAKNAAKTLEEKNANNPHASQSMPNSSSGSSDSSKPTYKTSMSAFGDQSVRLHQSYTGLADNRVIQWWEMIYWNWIRWFFTGEYLIAKDRYGNKFCTTWFFARSREERRCMYRKDKNKKHQPYGSITTDERQWERWLRQHRGDPPSVAEEEYLRRYKKQYLGAMVVGDEEVEDTVVRLVAHMNRSSSMLCELDDDGSYTDADRVLKPTRMAESAPEKEHKAKAKEGATWTVGFGRNDLFYNEEEVQVMRTEMGHIYRNLEWQELEYKRQVGRRAKAQNPVRKPPEGTTDPNDGDGDPFQHQWERTDLGIPYHDAIPDLTTPEQERLRIEADQLEDERWAIRKELGLTDLGDIREGRPPIKKDGWDNGLYQPPPVSKRWKPKTWEETWGTHGGSKW